MAKQKYNPFLKRKFQFTGLNEAEVQALIEANLSGVTLEKNNVISGVCGAKTLIESDEVLTIPQNYDYNTFSLDIDGIVELTGNINLL